MDIRRVVLVTHRWLGLATFAILAIVGTTGVVMQLQDRWDYIPTIRRIHRLSGLLHESLLLGIVGRWLVVMASALAVFLELAGLVLWWKRKTLWVRRSGWRGVCFDVHHIVGVVFFPVMVVLAGSGVMMALLTREEWPRARPLAGVLHNGQFALPIYAFYTLGTLSFLVLGLTGLVIWWPKGKAGRQ